MLEGARGVTRGDGGQAPGGARRKLGAKVTGAGRGRGGRAELAARQGGWPVGRRDPSRRRRPPGRAGCAAPAVKRARGAGGRRGGGARGGGLAPERRGVGAIKMHPMELPAEKDGTETRRPEAVVEAEDAREAAAAGK